MVYSYYRLVEMKRICICCKDSKKHKARGLCVNCYFREITYKNPVYREKKLLCMRRYDYNKRVALNSNSFSYGLYLRKLLT